MKLLQFYKNGVPTLAVEAERGIIDVTEDPRAPKTMLEAARMGEHALPLLNEIIQNTALPTLKRYEISFAPVITGMEKELCIGLNYGAHAAEVKKEKPKFPAVFPKYPNTLAAHNDIVHIPAGSRKIDYEAELVIICAGGTKAFAYTAGNDLSIREWQNEAMTWTVGKNADGFGPIGPVAVTADALDPGNLAIEMRRNGEVVQSSNTSDMLFSVQEILDYINPRIPLKAGDVIFTGTPNGVIIGKPYEQRVWLTAGEALDITIEGIGTLHTVMGAPN